MLDFARLLCAALPALLLPVALHAEDARSLPLGAPIKDGALTIGARTWTLPPDDWKLGGRHLREVKLSEVRAGAEVIEVFSARVRDARLEAGLMMTAPTGGTRVFAWREEPACRTEKALLREDSSTATLSDCLIIRVVAALPSQVGGAEVFASFAKWLEAEKIQTPRPILQVLIVKYAGDEYMRASSWLDPALFGLKSEELATLATAPEPLAQWARAYRSAIATALGRSSGTFTVPPFPAR